MLENEPFLSVGGKSHESCCKVLSIILLILGFYLFCDRFKYLLFAVLDSFKLFVFSEPKGFVVVK